MAVLLVLYVLLIHVPGLGNPETQQLSLQSALKDIALAGGALTWAGLLRGARSRVRRPTRVSRPAGAEV